LKKQRNNTAQGDNKTYRKRKYSKSNDYALNKGKWQVVILVDTLGIAKIRSNLHTGQI